MKTANPTILVSQLLVDNIGDQLQTRFPEVNFIPVPAEGELPAGVEQATGFFRSGMNQELFHELLDRAPNLQWVQITAAGFNWLMSDKVEDLMARGRLTLTRSAGSYNVSIGEFVIGAMFMLARNFPMMLQDQAARTWRSIPAGEIGGSTVGVVGAGAIGSEVAWRAKALGARVIGTKRTPAPVPHFDEVLPTAELDRLLQESDFVVLAAPLTSETRHLLGTREFRLMKDGACLINIGRGALTNEAELIEAMNDGVIRAAVIDVFEDEPLADDSPFWTAKNLIVTPHTSFRADGNMQRLLAEFATNLERFLEARPLLNTMREPELGY